VQAFEQPVVIAVVDRDTDNHGPCIVIAFFWAISFGLRIFSPTAPNASAYFTTSLAQNRLQMSSVLRDLLKADQIIRTVNPNNMNEVTLQSYRRLHSIAEYRKPPSPEIEITLSPGRTSQAAYCPRKPHTERLLPIGKHPLLAIGWPQQVWSKG
jgi:hypothetical protein